MRHGDNKLRGTQTPYVKVDLHKCKACWKCIVACPQQVIGRISFLWHKHIILKDSDNCSGCKKCIGICPYGVFNHQQ